MKNLFANYSLEENINGPSNFNPIVNSTAKDIYGLSQGFEPYVIKISFNLVACVFMFTI